ncbi:MAG: RNA polymerase sigma factor [Hyphomicrobiaceae bacterium]|nr:MAG: RNA polymerase sigma factor [Hyphomicrobiaceae bacterium]
MIRSALTEHSRRLYGYALSLTGDPDLAAELFQECALRALSAKRFPVEPPACRAWLFVVLRNLWRDRLRSDRTTSAIDSLDVCDCHAVAMPEQQYLDGIAVRAAMTQLSPILRDTLGLVDIAGFRYAEASEILGVPIGTVMSRVSEARRKLAALIVQEHANVVDHPATRKHRA